MHKVEHLRGGNGSCLFSQTDPGSRMDPISPGARASPLFETPVVSVVKPFQEPLCPGAMFGLFERFLSVLSEMFCGWRQYSPPNARKRAQKWARSLDPLGACKAKILGALATCGSCPGVFVWTFSSTALSSVCSSQRVIRRVQSGVATGCRGPRIESAAVSGTSEVN